MYCIKESGIGKWCMGFIAQIVLLLFINCTLKSQYIINGSLTGQAGTDSIPPYNWHAQVCEPQNWNNPDVSSNYLNNQSNSTIYPVDQPTFIILRARGKNYQGRYTPMTCEYLAQTLMNPLGANTCYSLSVYLCTDLKMSVPDAIEPNTSYPVTFKIFGSDSVCSAEKLLYESDTISNTEWKKFEFDFCTSEKSYKAIRLQVSWDTVHVKNELYNGILFVDKVNLTKYCIKDTVFHELYYQGDGKTNLTASHLGTSYLWSPKNYLVPPGDKRSVTMQQYDSLHPIITVTSQYLDQCPYVDVFDIKFDCANIHPSQILDTLYYTYFQPVQLNADTGGVTYIWKPETNLSDPTRCCPYLTGFDSAFSVTIIDKYNCILYQYFKIKALCDRLVPGKNVLVLDTTLNRDNQSILLQPKVGQVDSCLWKPLVGLEISADCQSATASPVNEIMYSVLVKDSFGCWHTERFHIVLELFVPNFISLYQDGYNDNFKIFGLPENTTLKIFDKSGRLIYSANHYDSFNESQYWKGTDNAGHALETGTYWYILENPKLGLIKKGFVFIKR
jgi:gliding motility-associated-like protein